MSVGKPMYFLWRLNVICVLGWRSPRMGEIGCYIIRLIGASIDWGIMFLDHWSAYMCGGLGFPWMWWTWRTYRTDRNREQSDQGRLDGFEGPDMNWSRIEIKLKDEDWFESRNGSLGAKYEGKEWWGKVHFMTGGKTLSVWGIMEGIVCITVSYIITASILHFKVHTTYCIRLSTSTGT